MDLSKNQKDQILDKLGKQVVLNVRDRALRISMDIVKQKTLNPIKRNQYKALCNLTEDEQDAICDLLSETITDVIYSFLEMIEENADFMKLIVEDKGVEYNLAEISDKMGSEIACYENGWIQKFSQIGRFIL